LVNTAFTLERSALPPERRRSKHLASR
jgi:hypothetical protein